MEPNNIMVVSPMRVGSTWVCEVIGNAIGERYEYYDEDKSDFKIWNTKSRLIKTHSFDPAKFGEFLDANPNVKIVRVRRDYRDALASRFYYARYHREESDLLDLGYPDDWTDADLVDCVAKKSRIFHGWLEDLKAYNVEFSHERFLDVNYEDLRKGERWWRPLRNFLLLDAVAFSDSLVHNDFEKKQRVEKKNFDRSGPQLFRREGKVGKGAELFTDEIYELIN